MRSFKIIITTLLLLALAGGALYLISGFIPSGLGPDQSEIDEIYNENNARDIDVESDLYSRQIKQYEGIVKPLGVSIYQEGTHRLEQDDSLIALLESEKINLPDFEEKEVQVRGLVRDTVEGGQKIMKVQFIEQLAESGVELFSDVAYEFSFSYPSHWEVSKEPDKVTFSEQKGDESQKLMIVYQYEDVKESLDQWLTDRDQNLFFDETQVKVGQVTGVRRTVKNGDQEILKTYVKEGKNAYELRLLSQDEVTRNQYFAIVDFFQTQFVDDASAEETQAEPEEDTEASEESDAEETEEASEETSEEGVAEETEAAPEEEEKEEEASEPEEVEEDEAEEESKSSEDTESSFSTLDPLSSAEIERVIEKGLSPFEGRTISFSYPKVWYFSYLGDGVYGFTDEGSYKANEEEISTETSRVLLAAGDSSLACSSQEEKRVEETLYTVCAREPGLQELILAISKSIQKPAGE